MLLVLVARGSFLPNLLLVLLAGLSGAAVVPFLAFAGIGEPSGRGGGQFATLVEVDLAFLPPPRPFFLLVAVFFELKRK